MDIDRNQTLKIIDDDGLIAIVNAKSYNETLNFQENWTWKQLNDFILTKNRNNAIVFSTGREEEWNFEFFMEKESNKTFFRKFEQTIKVTNQSLYLVSWSDLTATLQFSDTTLPDSSNKDLKINVSNGIYRVVVKQLYDPEDIEYEAEDLTNFIVELFPEIYLINKSAEQITWTEDLPNDDTFFLDNEPNEFDELLNKFLQK